MSIKLAWIGVDWGTTNLRVYCVGMNGSIVAEEQSDRGMNSLVRDEFEGALLELIEPWLSDEQITPVFACGMVGARQGWHEAEYRQVPCHPYSSGELTIVSTIDSRIKVSILPGLSQLNPVDVMRGEETQIAGFLANEPNFYGAICLPGTHTKWVAIENGKITAFKTFMTGELFSLLSSQSVLRHSVSETGNDESAFVEAALNAVNDPKFVTNHMFGLRALSLLASQRPIAARASLSGMIIGQEICAAQVFWKQNDVVLIGASEMNKNYDMVLNQLEVNTRVLTSKKATLLGLTNVARELKAT